MGDVIIPVGVLHGALAVQVASGAVSPILQPVSAFTSVFTSAGAESSALSLVSVSAIALSTRSFDDALLLHAIRQESRPIHATRMRCTVPSRMASAHVLEMFSYPARIRREREARFEPRLSAG